METVADLKLKHHVRWATDQEVYDPTFSEASLVAPHPEISGLSAIYPSKFEELFDLNNCNQHFASFTPPTNFPLVSKSFFSFCLVPWHKEEREEEEEELGNSLKKRIGEAQNFTSRGSALFEKDREMLFTLLESMEWIDGLLAQINARKLQYQKG